VLFPAVHFSNLPQFPRAAADNICVLAQYWPTPWSLFEKR
jgi:hypothetical protein